MSDITILYYTANKISDVFYENTRKQLLVAAEDRPIVSVSQKPIDLGHNVCVGDIGADVYNLYWQVLQGAKEVKTKYVATAEDDALYAPGYYDAYRPHEGVFAYNMNKWGIYTWSNPPVFTYKLDRYVFWSLICETEMLIKALTERFEKHPVKEEAPLKYFAEPGRIYDGHMGCTIWPKEAFYTVTPNVVFSHDKALGYKALGTRKALGDKVVDRLPYWGRAENIAKLYERTVDFNSKPK